MVDEAQPARHFEWWDMFVHPDSDPRSDGAVKGERATLVTYLRDRRLTFELKCTGLDADSLARRSVEPSDLSLLGLLRHLADVERLWFRRVMAGQDAPWLYRTEADPNASFTLATGDPGLVAQAWEDWRAEVAFAEQFVADAHDLDITGTTHDEKPELREILVHMIEEYARHNGHADFLRERIDGKVGQ
jgi:uncharacterized damage-inducible protein DinB